MRENDQCGKLLHIVNTWCVQVLRSPNLLKKNYSPQEAENAVISQRNHPVDVHNFHNALRHDCMAAANASLGVRSDHWKIAAARAERLENVRPRRNVRPRNVPVLHRHLRV